MKETLASRFCDVYVADSPRCSYIMLPKLLTNRIQTEALLAPTARLKNLTEYDGVPAYKVRRRFKNAILARGDSPTGLYGILESIFTEVAIRGSFLDPNVWLLNHNERARKRREFEINEANRIRKKDPDGQALHVQCLFRTKNKSTTAFAREQRSLSNKRGDR